jgi:parvulin-like peptidyl-prolyl isomerase
VARFDGQQITADELAARLARLPPRERARLSTETRRAALDRIVRFELLSQEAVREGLASDPEVVTAAKRVMVQKLLARITPPAPTEAEIADYFQEHASLFSRPAQVRLAQLVVKGKDAAPRAEKLRAEAARLAPSDTAGFLALSARAGTPQPERELRYSTQEALAARFGPAAAQAAFSLEGEGALSPPIEGTDGVHVFRLLGKTRALSLTLEQVRPRIVAVLSAQKRQQATDAKVAELSRKAGLTVDEKALEAVKVDPTAPAAPPSPWEAP